MFTKKLVDRMAEYRFELSVLSTFLGIFLIVLAIYGGPKPYTPGFLWGIEKVVGDWHLYFWLVGPALFIMGLWYAYDTMKSKKRFEELIDTTSRAHFTTNLHEIEELVWKLKRADRQRVREKKKELKVKRR